MKSILIRSEPGGISKRVIHKNAYPDYQLFIMLRVNSDDNIENTIQYVIDQVKNFITAPVFEEVFMEQINDGTLLHKNISRDHEANFKPFQDLQVRRINHVALNHFLCDEDIRDEMVYIYGAIPILESLSEVEIFFFKDKDSGNFRITDTSGGFGNNGAD